MRIRLDIELTSREELLICETSLERVLNNALYVAKRSRGERAEIAQIDIPDMTPLASRLWNEVRNAIFVENMQKEELQ